MPIINNLTGMISNRLLILAKLCVLCPVLYLCTAPSLNGQAKYVGFITINEPPSADGYYFTGAVVIEAPANGSIELGEGFFYRTY